ncbi:hypothetical protein SPONN_29 [uncultured Candidatus Thioglobus sp.]|nr:hypothetical protein SPONN_29 [uncultured Candidatus Thioglobus sp.]
MLTEWMGQCKEKSVLLLEGNDDCNIIKFFCQNNEITTNFGFCNCKTDSQVLSKLNSLLREDNLIEVIGIILDADNNLSERYQQIKDKVSGFYRLPNSMPKDGLVHKENGVPKLGIWIMPNNKDNGALEEFYLTLATDIDTDFIDGVIQQAENKNLTSFKPQHRNKAIMHTYFAWQDSPNSPLHKSINKIALNNDAEVAQKFKSWLERLFS